MVVSNNQIVLNNHTKLLAGAGAGPRLAQTAVKLKSCSNVARAGKSCQRCPILKKLLKTTNVAKTLPSIIGKGLYLTNLGVLFNKPRCVISNKPCCVI